MIVEIDVLVVGVSGVIGLAAKEALRTGGHVLIARRAESAPRRQARLEQAQSVLAQLTEAAHDLLNSVHRGWALSTDVLLNPPTPKPRGGDQLLAEADRVRQLGRALCERAHELDLLLGRKGGGCSSDARRLVALGNTARLALQDVVWHRSSDDLAWRRGNALTTAYRDMELTARRLDSRARGLSAL